MIKDNLRSYQIMIRILQTWKKGNDRLHYWTKETCQKKGGEMLELTHSLISTMSYEDSTIALHLWLISNFCIIIIIFGEGLKRLGRLFKFYDNFIYAFVSMRLLRKYLKHFTVQSQISKESVSNSFEPLPSFIDFCESEWINMKSNYFSYSYSLPLC